MERHRGAVQVPLAQFLTAESLLARESAMPININDAEASHHSGTSIMQSPTHNVTPANTGNVEYLS